MDYNYQIVKIARESLSRLDEMFAVSFGYDGGEAYYQWKYFDNPAGELTAFEAKLGNETGAFYGVIPEMYYINGEVKKIFQSMDTMTHPAHQKRGLFVKLARATYDELKKTESPLLIIGIPGSNSFHGLVNKLKWKNIHKIKYIFCNRYLFNINNIFRKDDTLLKFETAGKIGVDVSDFIRSHRVENKIAPVIDSQFLTWRVLNHPFKNYLFTKITRGRRLAGICVTSTDNKKRCIIEYLLIDNYDIYVMRQLIKFLFNNYKTNWVYTWQPTDTLLAGAYTKSGFIKNIFKKGHFSYRVPFAVYSTVETINNLNVTDINNYDLQPLIQD